MVYGGSNSGLLWMIWGEYVSKGMRKNRITSKDFEEVYSSRD